MYYRPANTHMRSKKFHGEPAMAAANITEYPTGNKPKKVKRPAAKKVKGKSEVAAMPESPNENASDGVESEGEGEGEGELGAAGDSEGEGEGAGDSEGESDSVQPRAPQSEDELFEDEGDHKDGSEDEEDSEGGSEGSGHANIAPARTKKAARSEPRGREPMEKDPAPLESRAQYVQRRVNEMRLESKAGKKRKRGGGGLRLTPDEIAGAEFDEMDIQGNGARKRRMGPEALLACQGSLRASMRASRNSNL
jgi:hypothetical protein